MSNAAQKSSSLIVASSSPNSKNASSSNMNSDTRLFSFGNNFFHYVGDASGGLLNGFGVLYFNDGGTLEGTFLSGELQGEGTRRWADGSIYMGEFRRGELHGNGRWIDLTSGDVYEGNVAMGERSGVGHLINRHQHLQYQGEFQRHLFHGLGTLNTKEMPLCKGNFKQGLAHGWMEKIEYGNGDCYIGRCVRGVPEQQSPTSSTSLLLPTPAEKMNLQEGGSTSGSPRLDSPLPTRGSKKPPFAGGALAFLGAVASNKPAQKGHVGFAEEKSSTSAALTGGGDESKLDDAPPHFFSAKTKVTYIGTMHQGKRSTVPSALMATHFSVLGTNPSVVGAGGIKGGVAGKRGGGGSVVAGKDSSTGNSSKEITSQASGAVVSSVNINAQNTNINVANFITVPQHSSKIVIRIALAHHEMHGVSFDNTAMNNKSSLLQSHRKTKSTANMKALVKGEAAAVTKSNNNSNNNNNSALNLSPLLDEEGRNVTFRLCRMEGMDEVKKLPILTQRMKPSSGFSLLDPAPTTAAMKKRGGAQPSEKTLLQLSDIKTPIPAQLKTPGSTSFAPPLVPPTDVNNKDTPPSVPSSISAFVQPGQELVFFPFADPTITPEQLQRILTRRRSSTRNSPLTPPILAPLGVIPTSTSAASKNPLAAQRASLLSKEKKLSISAGANKQQQKQNATTSNSTDPFTSHQQMMGGEKGSNPTTAAAIENQKLQQRNLELEIPNQLSHCIQLEKGQAVVELLPLLVEPGDYCVVVHLEDELGGVGSGFQLEPGHSESVVHVDIPPLFFPFHVVRQC